MTLHQLKPEEFGVLANIGDGFVPDPKSSVAIVSRDEQGISGRVFLMAPVHVEGPWVRPDQRGTPTAYNLFKAVETVAKRCGVKKTFAYAISGEIEDYLTRLGYQREPFTVWSKEM